MLGLTRNAGLTRCIGLTRNAVLTRSSGLTRCDGDYGARIGLRNPGTASCRGDGSKGGSSNVNTGPGCRTGRTTGEAGALFKGRAGHRQDNGNMDKDHPRPNSKNCSNCETADGPGCHHNCNSDPESPQQGQNRENQA